MIQSLTGSRAWPAMSHARRIFRLRQSMFFRVLGLKLKVSHFQRSCVWSTGLTAETPFGHSAERATIHAKSSTCQWCCLVTWYLLISFPSYNWNKPRHYPLCALLWHCLLMQKKTYRSTNELKIRKVKLRACTRCAEQRKLFFPFFQMKCILS